MSIKSSTKRPIDVAYSGANKARGASKDSERYDPQNEQLERGKGSKEGGVQSSQTIDHGALIGLGGDDHSLYPRIYTGTGSPAGSVNAARAGCIYIDTSGNNVWAATASGTGSWVQLN